MLSVCVALFLCTQMSQHHVIVLMFETLCSHVWERTHICIMDDFTPMMFQLHEATFEGTPH